MKNAVRNTILTKLNAMTSAEKKQLSSLIQHQLKLALANETGHWVAYHNLKDEPEINWQAVSEKIDWVFPRIDNTDLEFRKSAKIFNRSDLGFLEPHDGSKLELSEVDGFVIPGLSFDRAGHRLGRGKGFYDRALADYKGKKIGVCFNLSVCEELLHEGHDIACDQIVTENQIFNTLKSEGVRKWN